MISTPEDAAAYVVDWWEVTHDAYKLMDVPAPFCCSMTRLALVEIALEHQLGVPTVGGMNHAEVAVLLVDLCRRGLEQVSGEAVSDLLADLGLNAPEGHSDV